MQPTVPPHPSSAATDIVTQNFTKVFYNKPATATVTQSYRVSHTHTDTPTHRHTNTPTPPMHPPTRVHSTTRLAKSCTFYGFSLPPGDSFSPPLYLGACRRILLHPPLAKNRILRSPLLVFSWEITDLSWF